MPRPRRRSDEEILAAVVRAVGEHGPAEVTLADIAQEASLSPAALLRRFGSKSALLAAVAAEAPAHAERAFDAAEAAAEAPLEAVHDALRRLAADVATPRQLAHHLAWLQLDLAEPEARRLAAAQAAAVRARLAPLLADAAERGEVRGDPERLARVAHIAYTGALLTWTVEGEGALADWLAARVDDALGHAANDRE